MIRILSIFFAAMLSACSTDIQPQATSTAPKDTSPGAEAVRKYCSGCHGAPLATAHTSREWPNVLYRMQRNFEKRGFEAIPASDFELISNYLRENAKK